jgi:hypothetical protein
VLSLSGIGRDIFRFLRSPVTGGWRVFQILQQIEAAANTSKVAKEKEGNC